MTHDRSSIPSVARFVPSGRESPRQRCHELSPPRQRVTSALGRYLAAAFFRWQRSRTIAALESLEDWMLDDIGITRARIPQVADDTLSSIRADATTLKPPVPLEGTPMRCRETIRQRVSS